MKRDYETLKEHANYLANIYANLELARRAVESAIKASTRWGDNKMERNVLRPLARRIDDAIGEVIHEIKRRLPRMHYKLMGEEKERRAKPEDVPPLTCLCGKTFDTPYSYYMHIIFCKYVDDLITQAETTNRCPICGAEITGHISFANHLKRAVKENNYPRSHTILLVKAVNWTRSRQIKKDKELYLSILFGKPLGRATG